MCGASWRQVDCGLVHTARKARGSLILGTLTLLNFRLVGGCSQVDTAIDAIAAARGRSRPELRAGPAGSPAEAELARLIGTDPTWRVSTVNAQYSLCRTYPGLIAVPTAISDSVLTHSAPFRVKNRLPILAFRHSNGAVIARSGQPLVGLARNRSIQDEKLVAALHPHGPLLIIDARPTVNALANTLTGAGCEPMDRYKDCQRSFVNLENIHMIRSAFIKLLGPAPSQDWHCHVRRLLKGTLTIVRAVEAGQAVLVHCSDGWDRTSQLVSLAKLCLDPHYRTVPGLYDLISMDWLGPGHKFADRLAHNSPLLNALHVAYPDPADGDTEVARGMKEFFSSLTRPSFKELALEEFCPIFPQFLDCVAQLILADPAAFQYQFHDLHRIYIEAMVNSAGLFAENCESNRTSVDSASWTALFAPIQESAAPGPTVIYPDLEHLDTSFTILRHQP